MEKVKFKKLKPDSNGNTCSIENENAKAICWHDSYAFIIYRRKRGMDKNYAKLTTEVRLYARTEKELKEKIQALSNFLDRL